MTPPRECTVNEPRPPRRRGSPWHREDRGTTAAERQRDAMREASPRFDYSVWPRRVSLTLRRCANGPCNSWLSTARTICPHCQSEVPR